jgi:hypothetical protein
MKTEDGFLHVIAGSSRCGKTTWCARQVAKSKRIMAWDPEDQWAALPGWRKITTRAALVEAAQKPGPMKVAYVAGGDLKSAFDHWAACVMFAGRYVGPLDAIAEELADVTTASKAPGNWGILLRRGLKRGINIWAISQRWAEADKTAIGNASDYICFSMGGDDIDYMARKTRIPVQELDALKAFEWVRIDRVSKEITRGRLPFRKK